MYKAYADFDNAARQTFQKNNLLEGSPWNGHFSYDYITPQFHLPYTGKIDLSRVNHMTSNLPITKNNEQCDVQRQKAQNPSSNCRELVTVCDKW